MIPETLKEWRVRNFKDYEVRKCFRSKELELYLHGPTEITIELAGLSETELLASALQLDFAEAGFVTRTEFFQYDEWKFLPPTQGVDVSVFWLPILAISGGGISIPSELVNQITNAINARLANGASTYILLPEPSVSSTFYADSLEEARKSFIRDLQDRFQNRQNVVFLLWENWLGINAISSWSAPRFWEIGRIPGSPSLVSHIAKILGSYIRNDFGLGIKAIAVDLDGTIWSGIVGDQGVESLMLDQFGEGRSHLELQRFLVDQHNKGIFLGIVSKNDPAIVKEVFVSRPEMLIKEAQIAYWGITWEKKSESIRKMADALNIHPTSILFIDDSEFEISEVKGAFPDIRTIHVAEDMSSLLEELQKTGLFQITRQHPTRTVELNKPENRAGVKQDHEFIVEVKQFPLNLDHLDRATSLVNKTNQFNLTSNRTSRARLWDLAQNPDCLAMVYEVDENSQSKGIMSVLVIDKSRDVMRIEDWVLSCRAFSRGIEWWILWNIAKELDSRGIGYLKCQLKKTDRTSYIENFMDQIRSANLIDLDHNLKVKTILESKFVLDEIRGVLND